MRIRIWGTQSLIKGIKLFEDVLLIRNNTIPTIFQKEVMTIFFPLKRFSRLQKYLELFSPCSAHTLIFSTTETALISWDAVLQNTHGTQSHGNYLVLPPWLGAILYRIMTNFTDIIPRGTFMWLLWSLPIPFAWMTPYANSSNYYKSRNKCENVNIYHIFVEIPYNWHNLKHQNSL